MRKDRVVKAKQLLQGRAKQNINSFLFFRFFKEEKKGFYINSTSFDTQDQKLNIKFTLNAMFLYYRDDKERCSTTLFNSHIYLASSKSSQTNKLNRKSN